MRLDVNGVWVHGGRRSLNGNFDYRIGVAGVVCFQLYFRGDRYKEQDKVVI